MDQELIAYLQRIEGEVRRSCLAVEGLREDLGLFCGAVIAMDDRLKHFEERVRLEVGEELAEVRKLVSPSYSVLDHRVRMLEAHREFQERDPIELIKERFGLGKKPE